MERIKFYSPNDMMNGNNLVNSMKIIESYQSGKELTLINDMLELYNIKKYFDNNMYLEEWNSEYISIYENILSLQFNKTAKYFSLISDDNIEHIYSNIEREYIEDFWELFDKFQVYKRITFQKFEEFIVSQKVRLEDLLSNKKIVIHFGKVIRNYLCSSYYTAEILLDEYERKHISNRKKRYFPKELTAVDKESIIINYINSERRNLNYLSLIPNIQSNKDKLEVSPETLLKAKKRVKQEEKELFQKDTGLLTEIEIGISKTQDEPYTIKKEGRKIIYMYSDKWIKKYTDYPTLLNNFIYLFHYVDQQMRCTLVNKYSEMSIFEQHMGVKSKNAYAESTVFRHKDSISFLQSKLFSIGIRIEEVIEWFFKDYISIEFNACDFKIIMPSAGSTILEKCNSIMPALESVLDQFTLYVRNGDIDFELLNIRTEQLSYTNIPSLINKKYVYGIGEKFSTVTYLLFSDQSGLGYDCNDKKSYTTFFELMQNIKLKLENYPDYYRQKVNWLIEQGYLLLNGDGYLKFKNTSQIIILKDFIY